MAKYGNWLFLALESYEPRAKDKSLTALPSLQVLKSLTDFGNRDPCRRTTYLNSPLLAPSTAIPRLLVAMQNHLAGAVIGSLAWALVKETRLCGWERGHYLAFNPK